ncbi:MAG: 2-oxoacid:acceptor oxidoreductase family protein [Peptococcaceae bacterium]|nr:2-oxoacid:acceptor oxidoreductase family protein [Peptococcaceae bacterium]
MLEEIILAGFGGQGVMSMGQLLAYAGMLEDKHVAWIPSYGPEMRGGTANCAVTISSTPISSPMINEPSTVIVLNQPSLERFAVAVQKGGNLLYNSSLISTAYNREGIKVTAIPANDLAMQLGNNRVANMILLGAFIQLTGAVSIDSVIASLQKVLPENRHGLIPLNRKALETGVELVK